MRGGRLVVVFALISWSIGLAGCGNSALPRTHPASGMVVYPDGKPIKGGGSIQFVSADDPTLRISGEIKPNGSFVLRTVRDNEQAPGAPLGEFEVTIQPKLAVDPRGVELGAHRVAEPIVLERKQKIHAGENQMKIEIPMPPPS